MATMIARSSSLNPQAAEYFPSNYYNHQFHSLVHDYGCPVFPSLICYSATVTPPSPPYLLPQQNHEVLISRATVANPNPCAAVSEQTHLMVEPADGVVITDEVGSPSGAHANRGVRGGRHGNWKSSGVIFNGRERRHSKGQGQGQGQGQGHDNQNFKKQWNARSDSDGKKSKNIKKISGGRHSSVARSCKPNNRHVVPVYPNGQNTTVMIRNIPNRYTYVLFSPLSMIR